MTTKVKRDGPTFLTDAELAGLEKRNAAQRKLYGLLRLAPPWKRASELERLVAEVRYWRSRSSGSA